MQRFNKLILFFVAVIISSTAMNAQVFFSEDFADALPAEWTAVEVQGNDNASSNWIHSTTGPSGTFAIPSIASTTADNGWMMFDGDLNCNYDGQDAWLISPAIDCSDKAVVYLIAENYYRKYQDTPSIMVGTDMADLTSWNQINIYEGVAANGYGGIDADENPSILSVDLSEFAANTAGVHFAFRFTGACDYSWQIDDVTLTDVDPTPGNDLRVNPFFATAQNAQWPLNQVEPIYFLADVENIGSADQTNAILTVSVNLDGTGEVFNSTFDYGTIMSDSLVENMLFAESFTPTETGVYTINYSLAADDTEDFDPSNNTQSASFVVGDSLFAKDLGNFFATRPSDGGWEAGAPHSWVFGNQYHIVNGVDQYARTATFVVGDGSTVGEAMVISLYEWVDINEDGACDLDERVRVGFLLYTVTGSENENNPITLPIASFAGNDLELKDNADYVLIMEYTASDVGTDMECGFSDDIDYGATGFLHSTILDPAQLREASLLTIAASIDEATFGTNSFGTDFVPVMRLSIGDSNLIPSDVTETLPANDKVEVTPNPAIDQAILSLDLEDVSSEVRVSIFDISGRKVFVQILEGVQNQQVALDVSSISAGIYMVNVITDKGFATRQLVVNK